MDGVKYVLDPNSSKFRFIVELDNFYTRETIGKKMIDGFVLTAKEWERNTCIKLEKIAMEDVVTNGKTI